MASTCSMKIMDWNCRRLGRLFTIPQLKESIRLFLLDINFTSETKQKKSFVNTVCRRLKSKDWWEVVDPIGRKDWLLIFWGERVQICQIIKFEFCIEVEVKREEFL